MRGKASWDTASGNTRQSTNAAVLEFWDLVPVELELRCMRLRMYQSWAEHPANHTQGCAALFGQLQCEGAPTTNSTGQLRLKYRTYDNINPWAIAADIDSLAEIEEGRALLLEAAGCILDVFRPPLAEMFTRIDVSQLKSIRKNNTHPTAQLPAPRWNCTSPSGPPPLGTGHQT